MIPLPVRSPLTGGEIIVTRFYCPESDVSFEGQFSVSNPFAQLTAEQIDFIQLFIRCEGRISRMEGELGLSYPTIRSRLREIIQALGHEPDSDETDKHHSNPSNATEVRQIRQRVLNALHEGKITFEEALRSLKAEET